MLGGDQLGSRGFGPAQRKIARRAAQVLGKLSFTARAFHSLLP